MSRLLPGWPCHRGALLGPQEQVYKEQQDSSGLVTGPQGGTQAQ